MPPETPEHKAAQTFEGHAVIDTKLSFTGVITHVYTKPVRELHHGETLFLFVVAEVDRVALPRVDDGVVRDQKLKVLEAFELRDGQLDIRRVLAGLRHQVRRDVAARTGDSDDSEQRS